MQQAVPQFLAGGFVNLTQLFSTSCQCCSHGWDKLENIWDFLPWAPEGWPLTDERPGSIHTVCLSVLPWVWDLQAGTGVVQGIDQNRKNMKGHSEITSVFLTSKAVWTYFPFFLCRLLGNVIDFWQQDDPVSLTVAKGAHSFQWASVGQWECWWSSVEWRVWELRRVPLCVCPCIYFW